MNKNEAKERVSRLSVEINKLRYDYHVLDKPEVTDEIYSLLMAELKEIEERFPEFKTADSPTQRIGGKPLEKFIKIKHKVRQWSFDDAFNFSELTVWEKKIKRILGKIPIMKEKGGLKSKIKNLEYCAEIKIDGLKIILTYEKGILISGATRGDGVIGEDVTENLKTVASIPLKLKYPVDLVAVGECWLSKNELERINSARKISGEALFANSRNLAAGSIRQLDPKIAASRKLDSFIYDIDYLKNSSSEKHFLNSPETQIGELELLRELGFKVNREHKLCQSIFEVEKFYQDWIHKKDNQEYGIDGVVVKINSKEIQDILGYTGKSPRWGVAYKFPAEKAITTVEDIFVQVGRTGALTPVAHLRPVSVSGSTISRTTLHNEDEIARLDVRIGDTVVIRKAGDVIPEMVNVLKNLRTGKEKKFHMPKTCPICGGAVKREVISRSVSPIGKSDTERIKNFSKKSAAHYCLNKNCYAIEREKIIHFVSKKGFNIEGVGAKIVEQLVSKGLIANVADIFELKSGDLKPLERFAEKSAENLTEAVKKSKRVEFIKFLYALGIRHIGEETALLIKRNLKSVVNYSVDNLNDIIKIFPKIKNEEWLRIKGMGEKSAESITEWFNNQENLKLLEKMRDLGVEVFVSELQTENANLNGATFVLTGELENFTRDQARDMIIMVGGSVSSSVSKKTDYVLAGNNPGSKYQKAKKLGVKIIDEDDFKKMIK